MQGKCSCNEIIPYGAVTWRLPHCLAFYRISEAIWFFTDSAYYCVPDISLWSTELQHGMSTVDFVGVFWPKISFPTSLARSMAAAMFQTSYLLSHAWPCVQSWSATGAPAVSQVRTRWRHSPTGVDCGNWTWEVHPCGRRTGKHQQTAVVVMSRYQNRAKVQLC